MSEQSQPADTAPVDPKPDPAALQAQVDDLMAKLQTANNPDPNVEGSAAQRFAEFAARYQAEADTANNALDLAKASLAMAQKSLADQTAASAAAIAQLQAEQSAVITKVQSDAFDAVAAAKAETAAARVQLAAWQAKAKERGTVLIQSAAAMQAAMVDPVDGGI